MGKKQASARLKNKVKHLIARSIAQMEKTVSKERETYASRHQRKMR
jgi:hypothetical protein